MPTIPPEDDDPTPEALARATSSAYTVFAATCLDQKDDPEVAEACEAVQGWFARWDDQIQALERGEDDGCPCESCREKFGPLPRQ